MAPALIGSAVNMTCPKCQGPRAKVALDTLREVFFRCSTCHHAWKVVKASAPKLNKAS